MKRTKKSEKATKRTKKAVAAVAAIRDGVLGALPPRPVVKATEKAPKLDAMMRVVGFDRLLWEKFKSAAHGQKRSVRDLMHEALDRHLEGFVARFAGLTPPRANKRVRATMDADLLQKLHTASDRAGVPMVQLLRLCMAAHMIPA